MSFCLSCFGGRRKRTSQGKSSSNTQSVGDRASSSSSREQLLPLNENNNGANGYGTIPTWANNIARIPPLAPRESKELQRRIAVDLEQLARSSTSSLDQSIILSHELADFWCKQDRYRFYRNQLWYPRSMDLNNEMGDYLKILSILILIRFEEWDQFEAIFVKRHRRDVNLPFPREELVKEDFLGPYDGHSFFKNQWQFCPLVIQERPRPYVLSELHYRFPYIEPEEKIGDGATGSVYKVVIAPHHLKYETSTFKTENTEPRKVAVKRVIERNAEQIEFENLTSLRECLSQHSRIMVNITTIKEQFSQVGPTYHIFYDLAAFSLETLLTEGPRAKRNDAAPDGRNNSDHWWAGDVIQECRYLADALKFLHSGLVSTDVIACTHNDLKPENILVFFPNNIEQDVTYPVGIWKITDFGLSKIKPKRRLQGNRSVSDDRPNPKAQLDLLSPIPRRSRTTEISEPTTTCDLTHRLTPSLSKTKTKRNGGKFTAPWIKERGEDQEDARTGDVWSFGAILCEVVGYGFYDENGNIKPRVSSWLENLRKNRN
ncbi:hypothetical protein M501DRAFT_995675, partial [Patellaria atrata CBS 101060]